MRCPHCQQVHAVGVRFCPITGASIPKQSANQSKSFIMAAIIMIVLVAAYSLVAFLIFEDVTSFPLLESIQLASSRSNLLSGMAKDPHLNDAKPLAQIGELIITQPPVLETIVQQQISPPVPTSRPEPSHTSTYLVQPDVTQTHLPAPSRPVPGTTSTPLNRMATKNNTGGMVYIPGGSFSMGATEEDMNWHLDSCNRYASCNIVDYIDMTPRHTVALNSYFIDIHEVTNGEYRACVNARVCSPPESIAISQYLEEDYFTNTRYEDFPAVAVSWNDATAYCAWNGNKRLPTEAEWENAAKGTDDWFFPWTRRPSGHTAKSVFESSTPLANFCDVNCPMERWDETDLDDDWKGPAPVMSFPSGPFGLYDMAGNVVEWMQDYYGDKFYSESPSQNPLNRTPHQYRVTRGGGWNNGIYHTSSIFRSGQSPDNPKAFIGFRCVKDPD